MNIIIAALLLLGASFVLLGAYGLAKLPDFFTRLHAPTKASTLGVGAIVLATMLHHVEAGELVLKPLLLFLFIFISAPVSAYFLAACARAEQRKSR